MRNADTFERIDLAVTRVIEGLRKTVPAFSPSAEKPETALPAVGARIGLHVLTGGKENSSLPKDPRARKLAGKSREDAFAGNARTEGRHRANPFSGKPAIRMTRLMS